jgi:hypothetical protein
LDNELRGDVMAAHRRKKKDAERVAIAKLVYGVPAATGPRRVSVEIGGRYGRKPDPLAPFKSLLDALTRCGLLVDDDTRYCVPEPARYVRGPKGTVIVLEDMP